MEDARKINRRCYDELMDTQNEIFKLTQDSVSK